MIPGNGEGDGGGDPAIVISGVPDTEPPEIVQQADTSEAAQATADVALQTALDAQSASEELIQSARDDANRRVMEHEDNMRRCMASMEEMKEWQQEADRRARDQSSEMASLREAMDTTHQQLRELLDTMTATQTEQSLIQQEDLGTQSPPPPGMMEAATEEIAEPEQEASAEESAEESPVKKPERARRQIIRLR